MIKLLFWISIFGLLPRALETSPYPHDEEKVVMVFGVFDPLHPGHHSFLNQAKEHGKLVVVVTRDAIVLKLKNRKPCNHESTRLTKVKELMPDVDVILGDEELGTYGVIKHHKPDIICLGYDQQGLGSHLQKTMDEGKIPSIPLVGCNSFEPEKYHTTILRELLDDCPAMY